MGVQIEKSIKKYMKDINIEKNIIDFFKSNQKTIVNGFISNIFNKGV